MRCIFTGGGTLGHTYPAIAVAERIRKIDNKAEILFLMRKDGPENKCVLERGFKLIEIPSEGFQRNGGVLKAIDTGISATKGVFECIKIIKRFNPDFIFGTGGYVSFGPLMAGLIKRVPTFIHESNSTPGLVTKLTVKLGATPLVSTEETKRCLHFKKECTIVGTPLLHDFGTISKSDARAKLGIENDKIFILSFGGSGGSKTINDIVIQLMSKREKNNSNILHLHATGEKYFMNIKSQYENLACGQNGQKIVPKIENMALYMSAADIIICRCGASTLSEIIAVGRAAILIPSPNVTDNHQYKNGKYLADKNAAILIKEDDLTEEMLKKKIALLAGSESIRKTFEKSISKLKKYDAANTIADILLKR